MAHSNNKFLICTIFDSSSSEHGPLFFAPSLQVAWRNVDSMLKDIQVERSQFFLCVHGEFDRFGVENIFQPHLASSFFNCHDRSVVSLQQVKLIVDQVKSEFSTYVKG